mmetsp:Transcript_52658/g.145607  ORF Transcript_52658/g.145607 Transcript_52658/m.145607 type:complete len:261 (+) Transcript_52658:1129-1911(+)
MWWRRAASGRRMAASRRAAASSCSRPWSKDRPSRRTASEAGSTRPSAPTAFGCAHRPQRPTAPPLRPHRPRRPADRPRRRHRRRRSNRRCCRAAAASRLNLSCLGLPRACTHSACRRCRTSPSPLGRRWRAELSNRDCRSSLSSTPSTRSSSRSWSRGASARHSSRCSISRASRSLAAPLPALVLPSPAAATRTPPRPLPHEPRPPAQCKGAQQLPEDLPRISPRISPKDPQDRLSGFGHTPCGQAASRGAPNLPPSGGG